MGCSICPTWPPSRYKPTAIPASATPIPPNVPLFTWSRLRLLKSPDLLCDSIRSYYRQPRRFLSEQVHQVLRVRLRDRNWSNHGWPRWHLGYRSRRNRRIQACFVRAGKGGAGEWQSRYCGTDAAARLQLPDEASLCKFRIQLLGGKGLCQVVISSGFECAAEFPYSRFSYCEHNNRRVVHSP